MEVRVKENQLEDIEGMTTEYPYAFHHADFGKNGVPWHWHEEIAFDYIEEGSVRINTLGKSYEFRKNEAFFTNGNVLCSYENPEPGKPMIIASHLLHPVFLGGHHKSIFATKYLEPILQDRKLEILEIRGENAGQQEILAKLRRVCRLQYQENTEFQTRNLFSEIWLLLLEEWKEQRERQSPVKTVNQERIQTMLAFIHRNYAEKISLDDIAEAAAVSRRECLRCFRNGIRRTPYEYLLEYRLEMAEKLLRTTELSVMEIAMRTGFSGSAYFGKVFRESRGEAPGVWRKRQAEKTGEF